MQNEVHNVATLLLLLSFHKLRMFPLNDKHMNKLCSACCIWNFDKQFDFIFVYPSYLKPFDEMYIRSCFSC